MVSGLISQKTGFAPCITTAFPVELNVWDLGRFYQQETSQISEVITIDTAKYNLPEGIQCLKANIADYGDYDAYLAIVPGKFLADIYLDKGSRLLEGNVRSFLSARGKVNSKIRETINSTAKRHNFFIYNNGIAVVANRIQLSKDGTRLLSFEDFHKWLAKCRRYDKEMCLKKVLLTVRR